MVTAPSNLPSRPWLDRSRDDFVLRNAVYVDATRSLFQACIADSRLHGRFINTLAMLEHMGSHKIVATQTGRSIDQPTLRHIAEEAHHAYFMKRQAEKTLGRQATFDRTDLLAPATAKMYFQRLEAEAFSLLAGHDDRMATYLTVSMLIEFRALWFYHLYQDELKRAGHSMSLKRILGEEHNHLSEMAARLETLGLLEDQRTSELFDVEEALYGRMLAALQRDVDKAAEKQKG